MAARVIKPARPQENFMTLASSLSGADALPRPLSARSQIGSFIVMDVMSAAAAAEACGREVLHMEVGQPGTPAPEAARRAVTQRMATDNMGYTVALGLPELRGRIAQHYADQYGLDVPAERIIVTTGSSAGFVLSFLAAFNAGDKIALPSPGYPCYRQVLKATDLVPVPIVTGPQDRWMPTPEEIASTAKAEGLAGALIASPANPTGTMLTPERLEAIVQTCTENGMWFISDEIYHGLSYGVGEQTALAFSDNVIVINSFSKYFSMTGWRVGWMVVPEAMVATIERLTQNLYIAAPTVSQVAALGAFDGREELDTNRATYAANRDFLMEALPKVGLGKIVPADGAFYLYVDISDYSSDSLAFTKQLLEETGIAATPGIDFDPERGHNFVRFSYAGPPDVMRKAIAKLSEWAPLKAPAART